MEAVMRSGHDRSAACPLRASVRQRTLVAAIAALGGAAVVTGAALPWLTVFNGLKSYSGTLGLNGRLLAAGGVVAIVLALWYGVRGRNAARYALATVGFALALFSAYLVAQLLVAYRSLEGMFLPALGPGVFLAAAGALLIMATLLIDPRAKHDDERAGRLDANVATLIALSAGAGTIHLSVAADHLHEYVLFGAFFIALGVAQIGWAALIALLGPSRPLLIAVTANVAVVALWAFSRTTGLPLGPNSGVPEAVGFPDLTATLFEAILVAYVLLSLRLPRHKPRSAIALLAWVPALAVSPATVAAVLSAVDAVGHS
jgi:hypothetical protein